MVSNSSLDEDVVDLIQAPATYHLTPVRRASFFEVDERLGVVGMAAHVDVLEPHFDGVVEAEGRFGHCTSCGGGLSVEPAPTPRLQATSPLRVAKDVSRAEPRGPLAPIPPAAHRRFPRCSGSGGSRQEAGGKRIAEIEIIAHRGYSTRAPENTLAAIRAALDAKADSVEFDLHVAADGTPVLIHDASLGRTTNGLGPVRRRTLGQLRALDAGAWFSPAFEGERIPTLAEALEEVRGRVTRTYAEVKGYRELEDLDRIVDITSDLGMLAQTTFISLDWRIVERIHGRDEATTIGYVVDTVARLPEALDRAIIRGRAILDLNAEIVLEAPDLIGECHRERVPMAAWTINSEETAEQMIAAGIPRLTTDEVGTIADWRDRVGASGQSIPEAAPFPPPPSGSGTAGIST